MALIANSSTPGGAESYLYRLYEGLSQQGLVDVTLIGHLPNWPSTMKSLPIGIAPKLTRREPILSQVGGIIKNALKIRKTLGKESFDLVHMQYFREKLVLPAFFTRRIPVLWTEHGPVPPNFPALGLPLLKLQASKSTIIAVSEAVRSSLAERGLVSQVVWNPLPSSVGRSSARQAGRHSDYVLYAGRVHSSKRINLLLEAANKNPNKRFLIAGDGPDLENLRSCAPSNVSFLGHLPDVSPLMDDCLALVVVSGRAAREGSPMVVLEARSDGVPVLMASDCHAAEEARELGAHVYAPTAEALGEEIGKLGTRIRVDNLTEAQRELRGEERWLRETYNLMASLSRSTQS